MFLIVSAICFAQQTDYVDFKKARVGITDGLENGLVNGEVIFTFDILKATDSIFIDARDMEFQMVELKGGKVKIKKGEGGFWLFSEFKPSTDNKLFIGYKAKPKKALYFVGKDGEHHIWSQGQGKYTSNWIPSFDDMNEKLEFDISVVFDADYEVIANGTLTDKQINDSTITWHYDMQKPMSSYLAAVVVGKYHKKVVYANSGIPLEMYYYPEDSLKFEPTYRYTKQIFDFLEDEIGVPYPWQNYKMVPVKDFLYAGMENTSLNIYSDAFVVDSIAFADRNFVNINAHELAHQWFGDLVTEISGIHHWLQEGFATYYALLAEKEIFGEDYYYWRLYEYAQELIAQEKAGQSTSLLDPNSSSTTFYKKGAWVLHVLREKVGDKPFREAVKNYLAKHQFKNVETHDFISEVEKTSRLDLSAFEEIWLESKNLPKDYDSMDFVSGTDDHSPTSIYRYLGGFEFSPIQVALLKSSFKQKDSLKSPYPIFDLFANPEAQFNPISKKVPIEYLKRINASTIKDRVEIVGKAFKSNDIEIRKAIAQNLTDIPLELKTDYESLLKDKSYITIEAALFNLWRNFHDDREKYLNQTKGIVGFNDKNIRMLWLILALITEDYEPESKKQYFNELIHYTSTQYGFEVRQNAFQYLNQIQACNDTCKDNLKQATGHHNWRFKKFAKSLLDQIQEE